MDHYGARGELLAESSGQSVLGPCLVEHGYDRAYEFNVDGTTTVWARGQGSWVEAESFAGFSPQDDIKKTCFIDPLISIFST